MSIVLVIIGLIVGGILTGQSLITAAAIRAQVTQLEKISTGVNTFRDKYSALPGDMPNPATFGLHPDNSVAGNGDGIIKDMYGNAAIHSPYSEPLLFFWDLAVAGYIPPNYLLGTGASGPCTRESDTNSIPIPNPGFYSMAINPQMGMIPSTVNGHLWLFLGVSDCSTGGDASLFSAKGVMTAAQSYGIDKKIDDGIPGTGNVIEEILPGSPPYYSDYIDGSIDVIAGQCVTTASATAYNLSNNTNQCRLLVRVQGQ